MGSGLGPALSDHPHLGRRHDATLEVDLDPEDLVKHLVAEDLGAPRGVDRACWLLAAVLHDLRLAATRLLFAKVIPFH